ncbi:MAG: hypothetical protein QXK11_07110 [Pyrobaculum sp.]|uniref:hypothetical protein n=1 Tax=Pyrobaculum sp. TaxID=2004705 RepID=UPI0031816067
MSKLTNYVYIIVRYSSDCDFTMDKEGDCHFALTATIDSRPRLLEEMIPKEILGKAEHYEENIEKSISEVMSLITMWSMLSNADGVTLLALKLLKENKDKIENSECYHYKDPKAWYRENLVCWFRIPIILEI